MDCNEIYIELVKVKDDNATVKMAAYMRNKFPFLGVPTPQRKAACKKFFKQAKKDKIVDWKFVNACWENEYREMQYVAMDYLRIMQTFLTPQDIEKIKKLAQTKSWWDTIDGLDTIIGNIAINYPEVNEKLLEWSVDEDFWLRRIAIDHQLSRKDKVNEDLLGAIIKNNLGQSEFFINKAIGWSLRDYSKINPQWVSGFIEANKEHMAPLSIKEASKYL